MNKKLLLLFYLIIFKTQLFSQNPPAIEWQSISWADEDVYDNFQPQEKSGEDWWYNHQNVYDGVGTQTGYVTVGYSSLVLRSPADFAQAQLVFNEGPDSPENEITHAFQNSSGVIEDKFDFTSSFPEGCYDRDKIGEHRTTTRGSMALNDLQGNMIWCKAFSIGELGGVIQDGNNFYVVGVHQGIKSFTNHTFLSYNGNPSNKFNGLAGAMYGDPEGSVRTRHLYIAKIDMNGNVLWESIYGMPIYGMPGSPYTAMTTFSYGYSIIKSSNGNLIATGYGSSGGDFQPIVLEVNPVDGTLLNKVALPLLSDLNISGYSCFQGESHAITEIAGKYAIACTYRYGDPATSSFNFDDFNHAAVWLLDASLNPSSTWASNPKVLAGTGVNPDPLYTGKYNSNLWDLKYSSTKQELLVPVVSDCYNCASAGDDGGVGLIYRYNDDGTSKTGINPSPMGSVHAFDLRIGVEETSDGGFISVSSQHTQGATPASIGDPIYGYLSTCPDNATSWPVWDTDPLVVKYSSTGAEEWRKTFDIIPGRSREQPLGDLRQEECLYKITQSQDGGYVVSGNSSYNLDDNYLFKLYSDCNVKQAYTVSDPTDNIIDINVNTIWSTSKKIIGSVRINAPATLTITGSSTVIEFADSKLTGITTNIDVQIGAQLRVLSGSKLTSISACPNSMWDGIIIQGTTAKQLPASNQGKVVLISSTIENARKGIFVGGIVKNSGGILQATSATFKNNYIDAEFMPYTSPIPVNNIGFFTSCNFIGDAFLNDPSYANFLEGNRLTTSMHVILRGVKGIRFKGNNFKTDLTGVLGSSYSTDSRSYGIYSLDASFYVSGVTNNFDNLYYGIYAQSTNPLKTFTVDQTNFTNCYFSLFQSGTNYSTVTRNVFLINTNIAAPVIPLCVGGPCLNYFDYTNQCTGFSHSQNTYTVASPSTQKVVGSIYNNTGTGANVTDHNDYTGLKIGTQTQLTNGINASPTGLQIKCNRNYSSITTDILSTSGIMPKQGQCLSTTDLANNVLSHNGLPEGDIKANLAANNFIYTYAPTPSAAGSNFQIPLQYTATKVNPSSCTGLVFNYSTSCPLPPPCGFPCWFALAITNNSSANTAKQVLLAGDAPALYNAINSGMSAGVLKNLLISKSPFLSDGVLIAYLQRTSQPPAGHIKDVIIANSPVTAAVKAVLDNVSLPNGIRNQINAAQVGTSARKEQEDLVAYYDGQKQLAIDGAIRSVLNDTIISNPDSILETLLKFDGTIKGKTALTDLYISTGNYVSAQQLIDSLIILPGMDKHGKVLQHHKNIHQASKDWFEMNNDPQIKTDIEALSSDSLSEGFANARSVLAMVKGNPNYDLVEKIDEFHSMSGIPPQDNSDEEVNNISSGDLKIIAYPNPFKDEINININYSLTPADAKLQLVEIATGKIIEEQIVGSKQSFIFNTTQLSNGVYLIVLKGENLSPSYIKVINLK